MKISYNVRTSDMNVKEGVEVNVDTVYDRQNITEIVNDDGIKELNIGVEKECGLKRYIELMSKENKELQEKVISNELKNANSEMEMMMLIISLGGDK